MTLNNKASDIWNFPRKRKVVGLGTTLNYFSESIKIFFKDMLSGWKRKGESEQEKQGNRSRTWNSYRFINWIFILRTLPYDHIYIYILKVTEKTERRGKETWLIMYTKEFGNILVFLVNKLIEKWKEEKSRKMNSLSLTVSEQMAFSYTIYLEFEPTWQLVLYSMPPPIPHHPQQFDEGLSWIGLERFKNSLWSINFPLGSSLIL